MPIGLSSAFNGAAPAGLLQMYAELIKVLPLEEVRPSQAGARSCAASRSGSSARSRRGTTRRYWR